MMPKSAKRFSDDIMPQLIENDHVHGFGSIRSKIIVIQGRAAPIPRGSAPALARSFLARLGRLFQVKTGK
jgi:hypothetical protein